MRNTRQSWRCSRKSLRKIRRPSPSPRRWTKCWRPGRPTSRVLEEATRAAIVATLRVLFPTLLERAAGQEIATLLAEALTERAPEALTLRAHPTTLHSVAANDIPRGTTAPLTMLDDPTMSLGVAEIVWTGGGLTFDLATLHERVVAILSPAEKEKAI